MFNLTNDCSMFNLTNSLMAVF